MTYLPESLYTIDVQHTERLKARMEHVSPDYYEIYRDGDKTVHVVKIINAALHLGHELDGVEYGSLADLKASIAYWERAADIDNRDDEPLWTASRPPGAPKPSTGLIFDPEQTPSPRRSALTGLFAGKN